MAYTNTLLQGLSVERMGAYLYAALSTAAIYDHVITLELELDFIWRNAKLWELVPALFIINRYLGNAILVYSAVVLIMQSDETSEIVGSIIPNQCRSLEIIQTWGGAVVVWTMQSIMVTRIACLYHRSRTIITVQLAFFAVEIVTTFIMQLFAGKEAVSVDHICGSQILPNWFQWSWLPILAFEGLMLGLVLLSGLRHYKNYVTLKQVRAGWNARPLVFVLMRDSIFLPFIATIICLINVIGWGRFSPQASQVNTALANFTPRILGSRLVLNLREVYYRPFSEECYRDKAQVTTPKSEPPLRLRWPNRTDSV